jgi:hypothetical protein
MTHPAPAEMNPPATPPDWQAKTDADHLRLLAVFHFVFAGLSLLGLAFLGLHYALFDNFFADPESWMPAEGGPPPPDALMEMMRAFYAVFAVLLMLILIAEVLSGWFLLKHKYRTFSLIVAGVNCVQVPLGTVLGVFTFIVLLRDSVARRYAANAR